MATRDTIRSGVDAARIRFTTLNTAALCPVSLSHPNTIHTLMIFDSFRLLGSDLDVFRNSLPAFALDFSDIRHEYEVVCLPMLYRPRWSGIWPTYQ